MSVVRRFCNGGFRRVSCSVLLASVITAAGVSSASPADTYGFGSRSSAMGGAVTARVSDASANYYNPSGLALERHTQLSFGYVHQSPTFKLDGRSAQLPSLDAYEVGMVVPGRLLSMPVAFGFASHITSGRLARILTYGQDDRRWFVFDGRPEQAFIAANLAVSPWPWLSLGAGLGFQASTRGEVTVSGTVRLRGRDVTEYDSQLHHEVQADLVSVRHAILGATFSPDTAVDLGLSYRGEASVNLDIDSNIEGSLDYTFVQVPVSYLLESMTVASFVPRQLTLGGRYGPLDQLDLHMDVTWMNWSSMPSPLSATSTELSLDEPQGLDIELPNLPEERRLQNAGLVDRFVPRLGAEWRSADDLVVTWAVRVGYVFQPSPVTARSTDNLVDSDRHVLSLGAGMGVLDFGAERGALQLDTHVQWGPASGRTLTFSDETRIEASGYFLAGGFTLGLQL